jgi:hypothetical protein
LAGLLTAVSGTEAAAKGFHQFLDRKREGHAALRRFLSLRLTKSSPVLTTNPIASSLAQVSPNGAGIALEDEASGSVDVAALSVQCMARVSPLMEDKNAYNAYSDHVGDFKNFDLIRDMELWSLMDRLTNPTSTVTTPEIGPLLVELKHVISRAQQSQRNTNSLGSIENLRPLLRRCLLTSWLLPDQVSGLLAIWATKSAEDEDTPSPMAIIAQKAISELPKYFPGAFVPHVAAVAEHLLDERLDSVKAALHTLAAVGKFRTVVSPTPSTGSEAFGDPQAFAERLVVAIKRLCSEEKDTYCQSSFCRLCTSFCGSVPALKAACATCATKSSARMRQEHASM